MESNKGTLRVSDLDVGKYGELLAIEAYADPDLFPDSSLVCFVFEGSIIQIRVDGLDDTCILEDSPEIEFQDADGLSRISGQKLEPLESAVGMTLRWIWTLTNHQGYTDGFQLEFSHLTSTEALTIQLLALASTFEIRLVSKM